MAVGSLLLAVPFPVTGAAISSWLPVGFQSTGELRLPYLVFGLVLLVLAFVDLLWTTLWVDGGSGPLSSRLSTWVWGGIKRVGSRHAKLLSMAGPIILTLTLVMWIGLIWIGWMFVFAGGETALIDTRDGGPITWSGRFYYVAYSMFTMGNGDFTPGGGVWQIATALTTASGMLSATMAISYILSVLGSVTDKRSFASGVTGLGERSEGLLRTAWNGEDFHDLDLPVESLAGDLDRLAEQHRAYPILHYYHSEQRDDASAIAVAVLDEALTLLRFGVPEETRPNDAVLKSARSGAQGYLQTLDKAFIEPAEEAPPPPDLDRLEAAGIPTRSDAFDDALDDLDERRRKLLGVVRADGWEWQSLRED